MKKLALAAIAATFAIVTAAAPAMAQEGRHEGGRSVKKVVIHRDHGRHEGWRHRNVKKVVLHHDRGRHEGWRNHHGKKVVIIKKGGHHGSKTVIKKKFES